MITVAGVGGSGAVAKHHAAVAFSGVFGGGEGISPVLAGLKAGLGGQAIGRELILAPVDCTAAGTFAVAALGLVVHDGGIVHRSEGRVLVDGDVVEATAGLAAVSSTRVGARR